MYPFSGFFQVLEGIDTFPEAMAGMMEGAYVGKTIVKL